MSSISQQAPAPPKTPSSRATTPRLLTSQPIASASSSRTSTPHPRPSSVLSGNSDHHHSQPPLPEHRPDSVASSRRSSRAGSVTPSARLSLRSAASPPPAPLGSPPPRTPSRTSERHTIRDSISHGHGEVITEVIEEEKQYEQPILFEPPPSTPKMPYGLQPSFPRSPTVKTAQPLQMSVTYRQALSMNSPGPPRPQPTHDVRIQETGGLALKPAHRAFYGRHRHATQRFYWTLPPEHDERVSSLLDWIETMSWGLANLGLIKFLAWRNRGALLVNADFRPWRAPEEPAFDWITFEDAQNTLDRILQESIATYDPATTVLIFAFLVSKTGSSVGIWRRKVSIPTSLQLKHGAEVERVKKEIALNRPPVVKVEPPLPEDTQPIPISPPPPPVKKPRRRWFFFGRRKKKTV
ncbi:hypothetical protein FRC02_005129 [Tulasnella sp. 418]|nr:hypothetical protein FRC02_005129 [Tulasnella sp. 418]